MTASPFRLERRWKQHCLVGIGHIAHITATLTVDTSKLSFDYQAKKAEVEVRTSYPCHFERGIATAFARKCKPKEAGFIDVQLDKSKRSRLDGADSSFYVIFWL